MKYQPKIEKEILCPLEYGLDIFGGKWKSRILCVLSSHPVMRYSEVKREMGNITDAVLAAMLKELIASGLVRRIQYNEVPPRVEYTLTDEGQTALPILQSICLWSRQHGGESLQRRLSPCRSCEHLEHSAQEEPPEK